MSHKEPSRQENLEYGRACRQVRMFFETPKGKELKAQSDQNARDLRLAIQSGPQAVRALQSAQELWPDDDCACEAGIIFYHQHQRYKVGRCELCRRPEKPENFSNVKNWRD